MTRNNNLSVLPFYETLEEQDRFKWYGYGHRFSLVNPIECAPTFQIIIPDDTLPLGPLTGEWYEVFQLYNMEYEFNVDIGDSMTQDQGVTAEKFNGYILIKNPSINVLSLTQWVPLGSSLPNKPLEGQHFLKIRYNNVTYCSDLFTWARDVSDYIKLEYSHDESFLHSYGHIDYQDNFKNHIYIPSTIGKPSYEFEEDVVHRDGYKFPIYQVSYKRYQFEFYASEYLCDALRVVRMHDFVTIFKDLIQYDIDEILFTVNWTDQGNVARVVCEFTTDTVAVTTGRAIGPSDVYNPPTPPIDPPESSGDFNNDFNNDFFNN